MLGFISSNNPAQIKHRINGPFIKLLFDKGYFLSQGSLQHLPGYGIKQFPKCASNDSQSGFTQMLAMHGKVRVFLSGFPLYKFVSFHIVQKISWKIIGFNLILGEVGSLKTLSLVGVSTQICMQLRQALFFFGTKQFRQNDYEVDVAGFGIKTPVG